MGIGSRDDLTTHISEQLRQSKSGLGGRAVGGVAKALESTHQEFDVTMASCGLSSIRNLDKRIRSGNFGIAPLALGVQMAREGPTLPGGHPVCSLEQARRTA